MKERKGLKESALTGHGPLQDEGMIALSLKRPRKDETKEMKEFHETKSCRSTMKEKEMVGPLDGHAASDVKSSLEGRGYAVVTKHSHKG